MNYSKQDSPCRIDAHVHLSGPDALASLKAAGIAAVRDAGTKDGAGLELKKDQAASDLLSILTAGRALSRKGGYGGFFGKPLETDEEIKEEIRALQKAGAGIIKVMASGIVSLSDPGTITDGGFGAEQLAMIVKEAGSFGLGVMAHANGEQAIVQAARAGVRSIEHGFFMTDGALSVLAHHGVWWVPTVNALERAAAGSKTTSETRRFIDNLITQHLSMINKAHEQGVKLAIGTDAVLPDERYGEYYDAELKFFRRAGINDDDVARIACESGRELLGVKDSSK